MYKRGTAKQSAAETQADVQNKASEVMEKWEGGVAATFREAMRRPLTVWRYKRASEQVAT
jgi:hypothetical protein